MEMHDEKEKFIPIIFYMDHINVEYHKFLNKQFKNISPRDFSYLINIYYNPNLSQRQLAKILMVSEANVGQIIKRLEKNDLVKRDFDEKNKSRRIINLTDKGKSFVLSLLKASKKWEIKFFEKYSLDEQDKFKEMISDYYQSSIGN